MKSRTFSGWTKTIENPPEGYKKAFDKEEEFLLENVPKDTIVLDVGCGFGRVMKLLAPQAKKIIGIDNDKKAIEDAKKYLKGFDNIEVFFEDAEKMHFEDKSFGVVLCVGATPVNFGETKKKIYSEIRRVLKNKGLFLTSVYNENALEDRLITYRNYYEGDFKIKENGTVVFGEFISEQYSKEKITKILKENGFEILEIIKEGIFYIIKTKKK
jgi:2-polyprenyl-6-hydroxyphenyl methylase/3-demethylubiquinone-9 3-methyltransferase